MGIIRTIITIISKILASKVADLTFAMCVMMLALINTTIAVYSPKFVAWLIDKYTISLKTLAMLTWAIGILMLMSTIAKFTRKR